MPPRRKANSKITGPLTKEKVIETAVAIADEGGVESLTMRKLAEQLNVEAMSLYYHVKNKGEILDGILDAVFAEIELPSLEEEWKPAMRKRAVSAREVALRHRWAVSLMDSRANPGTATIRHHDTILGSLRTHGFSVPMAAHAISAIDAYVYGFVMQEDALPFDTEEELKALADMMLEKFPEKDFPHFAELVTQHALKPGYSYSEEFLFGLDLILNGLESAANGS